MSNEKNPHTHTHILKRNNNNNRAPLSTFSPSFLFPVPSFCFPDPLLPAPSHYFSGASCSGGSVWLLWDLISNKRQARHVPHTQGRRVKGVGPCSPFLVKRFLSVFGRLLFSYFFPLYFCSIFFLPIFLQGRGIKGGENVDRGALLS